MIEGTIDDRDLRDLMIRYQQADHDALDELVIRLSPLLLRYFIGSSVSRNEAEDVLQECWMRIHRSRHTYRSSEPVLPWIYGIARHARLDAYRKRRRLESREVLVASVPERSYQPEALARRANDDIANLVASLPDAQREVLVMLKIAGMSLEEVAKATASTVGSVKQKAHRAYATLRRAVRKDRSNVRQSD